ncbi:MAG: FkbM family methyltransferase [Chloroflexi bacterium]|nr:FkbM family methyltransferase [Chloroflexota bacterium]MBP8057740.1 FkbM family methyltransferase [Chloroflexota bacterium]
MLFFQRLFAKTRLLPSSSAFNNRATVDDVIAAYRLILRRQPDAAGFAHYQQRVDKGLTLEQLHSEFTNSHEYLHHIANEHEIQEVDLGGYSVCVRYAEKDFGQSLIETRQYEPHVCQALKNILKPGDTFVDVGANIGCISLLACTLVGTEGRVIALEPNPDNVQLLYAGIVLNKFTNIQVLPFAASNRREILSLQGGTSNTYLTQTKDYQANHAYAQTVLLDEALAHLDKIDVVKMDIEGHEPFALQGMEKLLHRHRPILVTEFNPRCLRDVEGMAAEIYAQQLLTYYHQLQVLTPFGDDVIFTQVDDLLRYWQKRDEEITRQQLLPPGLLHFDIVAT